MMMKHKKVNLDAKWVYLEVIKPTMKLDMNEGDHVGISEHEGDEDGSMVDIDVGNELGWNICKHVGDEVGLKICRDVGDDVGVDKGTEVGILI